MKAIKLLVAATFFCQAVMAQIGLTGMDGSTNMNSANFILFNLKDVTAADALRPDVYAGVEGTPFLSEDWTYARIRLADGRRFDSVKLKLNLYENKIHFKDEAGNEKMVASDVREIEIRDPFSKLNNTVYISGYGDNKNEFYEVITDGKKMGLMKKLTVIIKETKVFNAPVKKSFELQDRLFVYSAGVLAEGSKNCSSVMWAFKNDSKVTKYMADKDLKCSKEKDLKTLVDYYNSY